jgi:glycosyltransferase involved in cell wall biosynthesis
MITRRVGQINLKVAIVCSWLNQYGGAERVLEVLHAMYPEAPIYTSLFRPEALPTTYRDWNVRASPLQHVPGAGQHHQWLLPFYPSAFEHMNLSDYDLVISVPSAFAHGVRTGPNTLHICYCLTPARFLWDYDTYVQREDLNPLARHMLPFVISRLREWDRKAADHVDRFVGISHIVQHRIQECYQRRAEVIYPPTEVGRIPLSQEHGDYFLVISRLVPYKRIDLAVQALSLIHI